MLFLNVADQHIGSDSAAQQEVKPAMNQPTLFDQPTLTASTAPTFDGQTFDYSQDHSRLKTALERVAMLMRDGKPRTLREIADGAKTSEAGASARIRDLRKPKWAMRLQRGSC